MTKFWQNKNIFLIECEYKNIEYKQTSDAFQEW